MGGYFFFNLIFRWNISDRTKILLFFIVTFVYYMSALKLLEGRLPCVFRTSYAIVLGMVWKYKEETIMEYLGYKAIYLFASVFSLVGFFVTLQTNNLLLNPLFTVCVFVLLAYSVRVSKISRWIKFLSDISYEIYLWQGIWIVILCEWLRIPKVTLEIPLCLILDIVASSVAHYLFKKILCLNLVRPRV